MAQETDRQKALRLLKDDVTGYGATRSAENIRADLLEAIQAMETAGITLRGPRFSDPQNRTRNLPLTYANMKAYIERAEERDLADISNSLLMLHEADLQRTQGGKRRGRGRKTRRVHKRSRKISRARRS